MFYYSHFLRDDNKASLAACEVTRQNVKENTPSNNGQTNLRSSFKGSQRSQQEQQQQQPSPPNSPSSRLVWHNYKGKSPNLKTRIISAFPFQFQYKDNSKKETVHFASIEVQTYHCDYSCDEDVFIAKEQIVAMNKQRFKDASKLRKERNIKLLPTSSKNKENVINASNDDLDTSKRSHNIDRFLNEAFDPSLDTNEEVSICGIEHFVYPVLQQEMIRRKKNAKQEVFKFQEEKRPDPRGWRLARASEENTLWARDVATFKGMKYSMKQNKSKSISFAQSHRRGRLFEDRGPFYFREWI